MVACAVCDVPTQWHGVLCVRCSGALRRERTTAHRVIRRERAVEELASAQASVQASVDDNFSAQ